MVSEGLQSDSEGLSELQAQLFLTDVDRRQFLLGQLQLKRKLKQRIRRGLDPIQEYDHLNAIAMIDNNIQRLRVEGLVE